MMRLVAGIFFIGLLVSASLDGAAAQNLDQIIRDIGRLGQPRRVTIQAEWERISPGEILCVDNRLRRNRRSVNTLIDRGIGPSDNRVAGIVSECRAAADVPVPAPAQATERGNVGYVVNGMQLGSNFAAGPDSRDYSCAPSPQYDGFTECQRQTAERSRRRRISESASVLHAADGSAAYINQSFEPVSMGDEDADDEIARLSETYGKANLLPLTDARGQRSGVIAAWGSVSLLPLEPERRTALASGTDDQQGILIDHIGNVQRSAQQGLPVYRVSGGAGYVWSASWNGRGRGTLRMVAVDASRLSGAAGVAKPAPAAAPAAESNVVTAPAPVAEAPRPAEVIPPPAPPAAPKPAEPAAVQPQPKPAPPANVRVVGPPIELRPAAAEATAPTTNPSGGNGLVIFLMALVAVLLGAVGYLYRKSRATQAGVGATAPVLPATPALVATPVPAAAPTTTATTLEVATTPDVVAKPDVVAAPESKMDLTALVPAESPDSMTGSAPTIIAPKETAITSGTDDVTRREASIPTAATSEDK